MVAGGGVQKGGFAGFGTGNLGTLLGLGDSWPVHSKDWRSNNLDRNIVHFPGTDHNIHTSDCHNVHAPALVVPQQQPQMSAQTH